VSSEAHILATLRNARKSRGPQTVGGKAVVSRNAAIHGLSARQDVIRSESQTELDLHRVRMLDRTAGETDDESRSVGRLQPNYAKQTQLRQTNPIMPNEPNLRRAQMKANFLSRKVL